MGNVLIAQKLSSIIRDEKSKPKKLKLFGNIWREGELCVLIGDAGTGKTILGMQIGLCIADPEKFRHFDYNVQNDSLDVTTEPQKVLYMNFEMDNSQLAERFKGEDGQVFEPPNGFLVLSMKDDEATLEDYKESILHHLDSQKVKVLVIDNLSSFVAFGLKVEENDSVVKFMAWLKQVKKDKGISILLIHHPTKRRKASELHLNDIGGSSAIGRFIDSAFGIGKNVRFSGNARYMVQLKSRSSQAKYHSENVAMFNIHKNHNRLLCSFNGETMAEWECLKFTDNELTDRNSQIYERFKNGESKSSLARDSGKSPTTIGRVVKDEQEKETDAPF